MKIQHSPPIHTVSFHVTSFLPCMVNDANLSFHFCSARLLASALNMGFGFALDEEVFSFLIL